MLESLGYETRTASGGEQALNLLQDGIDLVLLDINMPGITGYFVAVKIRSTELYRNVPIIMVTALSSLQDRLSAVEAGANDFICKPIDEHELRVRIAGQLKAKHELDELKKNQSELERKFTARNYDLEEARDKIAMLDATDPVTGLPNHKSILTIVEDRIESCRRSFAPCSALFIELAQMKSVNEAWGHACGDRVLAEVGQLIKSIVDGRGTTGRWRGEKFIVVLPGMNRVPTMNLGHLIKGALTGHKFEGQTHLSCSVGIATYPGDGTDSRSIIEAADVSMCLARELQLDQAQPAGEIPSQRPLIDPDKDPHEERRAA